MMLYMQLQGVQPAKACEGMCVASEDIKLWSFDPWVWVLLSEEEPREKAREPVLHMHDFSTYGPKTCSTEAPKWFLRSFGMDSSFPSIPGSGSKNGGALGVPGAEYIVCSPNSELFVLMTNKLIRIPPWEHHVNWWLEIPTALRGTLETQQRPTPPRHQPWLQAPLFPEMESQPPLPFKLEWMPTATPSTSPSLEMSARKSCQSLESRWPSYMHGTPPWETPVQACG